jgi:transposase
VQALKQGGLSIRGIARELKLSRHTVKRFVPTDTFPERTRPPSKSSLLGRYVPHLTRQMQAGQTNGMQLYRHLCAQGYRGSRALVSRWVAEHRYFSPHAIAERPEPKTRGRPPGAKPSGLAESVPRPSARRIAWLMVRRPEELDNDQRQTLARLRQLSPEDETVYPLAQEFVEMVRRHGGLSLDSWLQRARESKVRELVSFANSLERDKAAVLAGLSLPYSNGQVEGQVNRLKLIRRSMYGRGQLDLLRKRVLAT